MDGRQFRKSLRRNLLVGLAFVLPLVLLAVVLYGIAVFLLGTISWVDSVLAQSGIEGPLQSALTVTSVLIAVPVVLVLTGGLLRTRYGERVGGAIDELLVRVPGVGPVYGGLRKSRAAVFEDGSAFREVVSLELTDGVDVLAFVVGRESGADWTTGDQRVTVFVPLSPNPTVGGHLLAVRRERVSETTLSVRAALTTLVTVGAGESDDTDPPLSGLYRLAEETPEP